MKRNKQDRSGIPEEPGVYYLYDPGSIIIYIGKAKNLRSRLSTYFGSYSDTYKTSLLKRTFTQFDYIVTGTELEALLLESVQIKKHQPRFNIMLKDDKTYPYLAYVKTIKFPYLFFTRVKKKRKNTVYYGPFVNSAGMKTFLDFLLTRYKLRWCRGKLPSKQCIYHSLDKCMAPCIAPELAGEYEDNFSKALKDLDRKPKALITEFTELMKEKASQEHFEEAAMYRDMAEFLTNARNKQYVVNVRDNFDVISYEFSGNLLVFGIFHYLGGAFNGVFTNTYDIFEEERLQEILLDFIELYYLDNYIPAKIILDQTIEVPGIKHLFDTVLNRKVELQAPGSKGKKRSYMELAQRNLKNALKTFQEKKKKINLNNLFPTSPNIDIVDAFDISHTMGVMTIGGVVRFKNFKPDKRMYRAYLLPSVLGKPDDYGSIRITLEKHLEHLRKHSFPMPHMILIDGGKGQLSSAVMTIKKFDMEIPVLSIAKGKQERIFKPDNRDPLILSRTNPLLKYIVEIRDEVHRWSISNHTKRRDGFQYSILLKVPGIGMTRAKKLLKEFKTLHGVMKGDKEALLKILPEKVYLELRRLFNSEII